MLLPAGLRQLELVCSGVPDHQPSKHLTTDTEQEEVGRRKDFTLRGTAHSSIFCIVHISLTKDKLHLTAWLTDSSHDKQHGYGYVPILPCRKLLQHYTVYTLSNK